MTKIQKTLVVLKPDCVARGLAGEVLQRFERVGLKIVAMKMFKPDQAFLHHHYETIGTMITRRGQKPFDLNLAAMQRNPVIAMVLEGVEAVEVVRKLAGTTESKSAAPGTIRGDYSHMSFGHADEKDIGLPNVIHASGDPEEAALEIAHWFNENEIFAYKRADQCFVN